MGIPRGVTLVQQILVLTHLILVRRYGDGLLNGERRFDDGGEEAGNLVPVNVAMESPGACKQANEELCQSSLA